MSQSHQNDYAQRHWTQLAQRERVPVWFVMAASEAEKKEQVMWNAHLRELEESLIENECGITSLKPPEMPAFASDELANAVLEKIEKAKEHEKRILGDELYTHVFFALRLSHPESENPALAAHLTLRILKEFNKDYIINLLRSETDICNTVQTVFTNYINDWRTNVYNESSSANE